MQVKYEWDPKLETGNDKIDSQHKSMFEVINKLIIAQEQGKSPSEIQKTMGFLVEYVHKHFTDEEELQRYWNYPDLDEHRRRHEELTQKVADLIATLDREGYSSKFTDSTLELLVSWLKDHIKGDDFKLAVHIRGKQMLIK